MLKEILQYVEEGLYLFIPLSHIFKKRGADPNINIRIEGSGNTVKFENLRAHRKDMKPKGYKCQNCYYKSKSKKT